MTPIAVHAEIAGLVRLGVMEAGPVAVGPAGSALKDEVAAESARLAARHAGRPPSEIAGLHPARALYRSFGIDPTRTRPSSEALLRRILAGKPFPEVNNAVDLANLCAVRFLLPLGLYDVAKLRGPVLFRRGGLGEAYAGIRKDEVHVAGRPCLVDDEGPFGNPTSDSLRTSVDATTRDLLLVVFAPADFPAEELDADLAWAADRAGRLLAGDAPVAVATARPSPGQGT